MITVTSSQLSEYKYRCDHNFIPKDLELHYKTCFEIYHFYIWPVKVFQNYTVAVKDVALRKSEENLILFFVLVCL